MNTFFIGLIYSVANFLFLVATPMTAPIEIAHNLLPSSPEAGITADETTADKADGITIDVKEDGSITINNESLSIDELDSKLKTLVNPENPQRVLIRGESSTSHRKIVDVINACSKAGISDISLSTYKP